VRRLGITHPTTSRRADSSVRTTPARAATPEARARAAIELRNALEAVPADVRRAAVMALGRDTLRDVAEAIDAIARSPTHAGAPIAPNPLGPALARLTTLRTTAMTVYLKALPDSALYKLSAACRAEIDRRTEEPTTHADDTRD